MAYVEPIVGRYLNFELANPSGDPSHGGATAAEANAAPRSYRVYFETAGQGIPLVCLHTAGADARQFRHLLNDPEITRDFQVVAFDLPRHGKSNPPDGWWREQEYRLTARFYADFVVAFCDALALDRPALIGCSMGGKIVLELALRYPHRFRALVGLECAAYQTPWYDREWLNHPQTNVSEVCAAIIEGLCAPQSPERYRWETYWLYAQSVPGVFKGDLYFYRDEGDYRGRLGDVDPRRCPIFLLTGEYDFSCTPEDTLATARELGVDATIMAQVGHFPMAENPEQFRTYLLPVLAQIKAGAEAPAAGHRPSP